MVADHPVAGEPERPGSVTAKVCGRESSTGEQEAGELG